MLKQVLLVRHAQSEEDINPNIRDAMQDKEIGITTLGKTQIAGIAKLLYPKIKRYKKINIITSSSNRAYQTMTLFCSYFQDIDFKITHEECIRNLNWGNVDKHSIREVEKERYRVGVLEFQFPGGDNTPEFVKKIESLVSIVTDRGRDEKHAECIIIFTHGFALRVLAKAFLSMNNEEFRHLSNPPNCYVATLNITNLGNVLDQPLPKIDFEI